MKESAEKRKSDSIAYAHWERCIRDVFKEHGERLPVPEEFNPTLDPVKIWLIEAFHDNWSAEEVWWEWLGSR